MNDLIYAAQLKKLQVEQWTRANLQRLTNNRGNGTIEYLALTAIVVGILAFVMSQKDSIGGAIVKKIQDFITSIKIGA